MTVTKQQADAMIAKLEALRDDPDIRSTVLAASAMVGEKSAEAIGRQVGGYVGSMIMAGAAPPSAALVVAVATIGFVIGDIADPGKPRMADANKVLVEILQKVLSWSAEDAYRLKQERENAPAS
jgi:hypothetical protein